MSSAELPEYIDDRARHLFERVFVGSTHGDAHGRAWSWGSTNRALKPTLSHVVGQNAWCAYCGNISYPIQNNLTYDVIGHACVCKSAMDEVDWQELRQKMLDRHQDELDELESAAPPPNKEVLLKVVERQCAKLVKDMTRGFSSNQLLKGLGIRTHVGVKKRDN